MPRLKLLTFDVKDTLLKLRNSASVQYAEAALSHGIKISDADIKRVYRSTWINKTSKHPIYGVNHGITTKDWWRDFVHQVFLNAGSLEKAENLNKVIDTIWKQFDEAHNWDVMPHAHSTLASLKSSGVQLGVISNFDNRLENTLRANKLDKYFDFVVTSWSAKVEKPNPAIFKLALKTSGKTAHVAGHIGDDIQCDYIAPRNVGMTSFLFDPDGQHTEDSLVLHKVDKLHVISDLEDLKSLVG